MEQKVRLAVNTLIRDVVEEESILSARSEKQAKFQEGHIEGSRNAAGAAPTYRLE